MRPLWIRFSLRIGSLVLLLILLLIGVLFLLDEPDRQGDLPISARDLPEAVLFAAIAVTVLGVGLGIGLSRGLSTPISELAEAAQAVGQGRFDKRVPVSNHSRELYDLATAFNGMAIGLEESERMRSQMLADVSHELRTPLSALAGQLRGALDRVYTLEEEELAALYGQTSHLIRLVEDLHLLAQAEAGQLPLYTESIDLNRFWQEITRFFLPAAEEKGVTFNVHVADGTGLLSADPDRLRQIVTNLLSNGLRHTPAGGTITASVKQESDEIVTTIEDSGDGIAVEHLDHLFERFYRADSARTRSSGGTGLGLAIVKALAERHGGTIQAFSNGLGQGSQFEIRLPIGVQTPSL